MGRDLRSPDSLSGHLSRDTGVETTVGQWRAGPCLDQDCLVPMLPASDLTLNFMSDSDNRLSGHWIPLLVPSPREATLNKSPYSVFTITCLFHWHIEGRHLCLAFGDRHSQGINTISSTAFPVQALDSGHSSSHICWNCSHPGWVQMATMPQTQR